MIWKWPRGSTKNPSQPTSSFSNLPRPASSTAIGYYGHNLHFIVRARTEQGLYPDARKAVDDLVARSAAEIASMPDMADYYLPNRLFLLLRFARWDDVLAEPAPDSKMIITTAFRHYARALAYAGKGDRAKSLEEQRAFSAARAAIPPQTMFLFNPADKMMNVAALVLEARLASDANSAIPIWRRAVEAQDALLYDDPPPWYYWIRQSLGAALLRSGHAVEAEPVFREGLRRSPRNPRLLFGLWKCLEAQGSARDSDFSRRRQPHIGFSAESAALMAWCAHFSLSSVERRGRPPLISTSSRGRGASHLPHRADFYRSAPPSYSSEPPYRSPASCGSTAQPVSAGAELAVAEPPQCSAT